MSQQCQQIKAFFRGTGKTVLLTHTLRFFIATVVAVAMIFPTSCHRDRSETTSETPAGPEIPEIPETPAIPELTFTPYINAADVWISMRYTP